MERQLRPSQLKLLKRVSEVSAEFPVDLFVAGGTVRDILAGVQPADLDLVSVGGPPDLPMELAELLGGRVAARSQFGTAKVKVGRFVVDLAAARKESYERPGALPDVLPGTIDEDLARRDFSINAMAVSLAAASFGELLDPFDGRRDLKRGVIRVLHAESFADDATRILRAVRYACRLGFRLEAGTAQLLSTHLRYLDTIGADRIRHELERTFAEAEVGRILQATQDLGVLPAIHSALRIGPAVIESMQATPAGPVDKRNLRLLALLVYPVPAGAMDELVARLNMNTSWARVARDVASLKGTFQHLTEQVRPSESWLLLRDFDVAAVEGCALAATDPLVRRRLELYLTEVRHVRPLLNGDDLMALGVPEGPRVGKLLEKLLAARLDGLLSTREDEEEYAVRSLE
jgi:tRNA nucleotidyltransferase (CCA-adding enzyme)